MRQLAALAGSAAIGVLVFSALDMRESASTIVHAVNERPHMAEQSIKSVLPDQTEIETEREPEESLEDWRDRHLAAIEEFSQQ